MTITDTSKTKRLIVVLGMHRSGTSAITRGLQVLGVDLGDNLIAPLEGNNEKGFWEDVDLNTLDVEILNSLGSDWHHLTQIETDDLGMLRKSGYFLRAVELLRKKFENAAIFGIKDPRVAKLLPFWKEIFAHCQVDVGYVLSIRNPLSVVKSLSKRDGFDPEKGYLLWLDHVLTSLSCSAGAKRIVVDYDNLMEAPERELNRMAKYLELGINPVELQNYKTEFLDNGLRHTVYRVNDLSLDEACPPLVQEIYAALLDVAIDKIQLDDSGLQEKITRWNDEFKRDRVSLRLLDNVFAQNAVVMQAVSEKDEMLQSLSMQVAESKDFSDLLLKQLEDNKSKVSALSVENVDLNHQIGKLNQYINTREQILQDLNTKLLEIYSSRAWRFIQLMWRVRLFLLPNGSKRLFLLKKVLSLFKPHQKAQLHETKKIG